MNALGCPECGTSKISVDGTMCKCMNCNVTFAIDFDGLKFNKLESTTTPAPKENYSIGKAIVEIDKFTLRNISLEDEYTYYFNDDNFSYKPKMIKIDGKDMIVRFVRT